MRSKFTTLHDLMRAFSRAMDMIDPEAQHHQQKLVYFSVSLAHEMQLPRREIALTAYAALLYNVGELIRSGSFSIRDLNGHGADLARISMSLLRMLPEGRSISEVVCPERMPAQPRLRTLATPRLIGQIVRLSSEVTARIGYGASVLNEVSDIQAHVHQLEQRDYASEVRAAFDQLCRRDIVWLEMAEGPELNSAILPENRDLSLTETLKYAEFASRVSDFRSPFTAMHSAGVAASAAKLSEVIGMSSDECDMMRIAGLLHDAGKMKTPKAILEKPDKLTDNEFNIMKEHAYYTHVLLRDIPGFEQIDAWASYHHEKLNGAGYPFHVSAPSLSLGARIMAVADVYSAIAEDRPYRKGMSFDECNRVLRDGVQRGELSHEIVEALLDSYQEINLLREHDSRLASKKYYESISKSA